MKTVIQKHRCIFFLCVALSFITPFSAQRIRVKIVREDTSFVNNNGDSSLVYQAYIYPSAGASPVNFTLIAQTYNPQSQQWQTDKDSTYNWSQVVVLNNSAIAYTACKSGASILKLCMGRLHFNTRRKFIFYIPDGPSNVINKEILF